MTRKQKQRKERYVPTPRDSTRQRLGLKNECREGVNFMRINYCGHKTHNHVGTIIIVGGGHNHMDTIFGSYTCVGTILGGRNPCSHPVETLSSIL